uniref:Uncharacterized protein n=1 Tax=uncultured marine virus TaxID=186617 RepID=S4TEG0_9VIRU|nr:hypothetical protein [uncultured marine virus]
MDAFNYKNKIFRDIIMPRPKGSSKGSYYKPKANFEKSVKTIVRKELAHEIEEKNAITQYNNVLMQSVIPSGVVLNGQGNFFKLLPEIFQSTTGGAGSAYNERIGNEITLKEIDIHGFLNSRQDIVNLASQPQNVKLAVRVMILRAKEVNDQELLFDNMPTDTLIRFGEQTTGFGGPVSYQGLPLDSFRDINRDTFSVKYDRVHYMNGPTLFPGTTNPDVSQNASALKIFRHKLRFGKRGLKLKYSASTDTQPNNFPYFMVVGYSSMSANSVPSNNLCAMTLNISSTFTDA